MSINQLAQLCALLSEYESAYPGDERIHEAFFAVWGKADDSKDVTIIEFFKMVNESQETIGQE